MSSLADRIRGIVGPSATPVDLARPKEPAVRDTCDVANVLGGEWRPAAHGACFLVERRTPGDTRHGHTMVRDLAGRLEEAGDDASFVAGGGPARPPFVFFDLETTGLSGGAGTYAFLVGCGSFAADGAFVTRQYIVTRLADERSLLMFVADDLSRAGALVSFNGKSFDAPVLETRYLYHRLNWTGARLPHVDVLHPARRFWGSAAAADLVRDRGSERIAPHVTGGCSLVRLERQVLGVRRAGDVAGFEIPARYFQFVRSGDARPLAAVLEHNRLDLLSLAGLTARLLFLVRAGAAAARDTREALALGRVYSHAGLDARARDAYSRAASGSSLPIKIEALRALALVSRRGRRFDEAAAYWRQLLDVGGCPQNLEREAIEALAIHHEHRVRDLVAAKAFALRSLHTGRHPDWAQAVQHRVARIERKMAGAQAIGARLEFTD